MIYNVKEIEDVFLDKINKLVQELDKPPYRIVDFKVAKHTNFVFVLLLSVFKIGFRSLPSREIYTIMYNPKTGIYTYHEGEPEVKPEILVN